jgi:hypothetical protein
VPRPQHSAKLGNWPKMASVSQRQRVPLGKVTITNLFYWIFTFHHNKHNISHISHIHPNIHHIYPTSITYIACITIYITYITISSQVHLNKSTSPSQIQIVNTSASQVHHQVNNKCKDNYPISTESVVYHDLDHSNPPIEAAQRRRHCICRTINPLGYK